MIEVFQTKFGPKEGNCLAACIASLMHLKIEDVDDFAPRDDDKDPLDWWRRFEDFVGFGAGLTPYRLSPVCFMPPHNAHYLIWGVSPRGIPHSVIGLRGEIVHDPHPLCMGLETIDEYIVFVQKFSPKR